MLLLYDVACSIDFIFKHFETFLVNHFKIFFLKHFSCKLKPFFLSEKVDVDTVEASDLHQCAIDHRIT